MSDPHSILAFDTGPLRHFAIQGWLGVLKFVTRDKTVVIPESVERELPEHRHEYPSLAQVFDADWIHVDRSLEIAYLTAFARFEGRLVSGTKNLGECGVLALGVTRDCTLVIDDATPRQVAAEENLETTTTLALLCSAIREGKLTVPMVEQVADDLLEGDYYLPFAFGGFQRWALELGLIDYPSARIHELHDRSEH